VKLFLYTCGLIQFAAATNAARMASNQSGWPATWRFTVPGS